MLERILYILFSINSLIISPSIIGDFPFKQATKYGVNLDDNIYIMNNIYEPIPPLKFDMLIINTTEIVKVSAPKLDGILITCQERLNTLGLFCIDVPYLSQTSIPYMHLLNNPTELWNYNLVGVEIDGCKISCRKGSSLIFNDREILKYGHIIRNSTMISNDNLTEDNNLVSFITINTGNPQIDLIINMVSYFLQFIFIFNFLTFGLMLLMNVIFK
jgi:hypothetical protein